MLGVTTIDVYGDRPFWPWFAKTLLTTLSLVWFLGIAWIAYEWLFTDPNETLPTLLVSALSFAFWTLPYWEAWGRYNGTRPIGEDRHLEREIFNRVNLRRDCFFPSVGLEQIVGIVIIPKEFTCDEFGFLKYLFMYTEDSFIPTSSSAMLASLAAAGFCLSLEENNVYFVTSFANLVKPDTPTARLVYAPEDWFDSKETA